MKPLRIGFIPFYVDYYESLDPNFGPAKLVQIAEARATLAQYGTVIGPEKPVSNLDEAKLAAKKLAKLKPDCLVSLTAIAVFSGISETAISLYKGPLLLWNRQEIKTVGSDYSMIEIVRNTGQIGTQALANVLSRKNRRFKVLCAVKRSKDEQQGLDTFFGICRAVCSMRAPRVLQIGQPFPLMSDIDLPEKHRQRLGITVQQVDVGQVNQRWDGIQNEAIAEEVAKMKASWKIAEISDDELLRSARLWLSVKGFIGTTPEDCATMNSHGPNCLANKKIGITATYAISQLHAMGIACSEVGDIPTALALKMGIALAGDALYTEVQVFDQVRKAIVLANSGEAAFGLQRKASSCRLVGNTNFKGLHGRGASFAYPLQNGPATVFSITPIGASDFRLIAMQGEILEESLPDTGAITGFFQPESLGYLSAYEKWIQAGPVHHAATICGHHANNLSAVAEFLDWQYHNIT